MKRFVLLAAFAALFVASCGQVSQDTYKVPGSTYGRSDGWYSDSSYNMHLIVNGSSVYNLNAAGTAVTLANGGAVTNDTDGEIQLSDASEDISFGFGTSNSCVVTSDTGVTQMDFEAIDLITDKLAFTTTGEFLDSAAGVICLNGAGGTNNEDVCFDLETTANAATVTTNTGVTDVAFGTIDVVSDQFEFTSTGEYIDSAAGTVCMNGAGGTNNEDLCFDLETTSNVIGVASNTSAAKIDFGTMNLETDGTLQILGAGATIGWTAAAAGNTACATTCAGTGACVFGFDAGTNALVACDAATADSCICAGPAS